MAKLWHVGDILSLEAILRVLSSPVMFSTTTGDVETGEGTDVGRPTALSLSRLSPRPLSESIRAIIPAPIPHPATAVTCGRRGIDELPSPSLTTRRRWSSINGRAPVLIRFLNQSE